MCEHSHKVFFGKWQCGQMKINIWRKNSNYLVVLIKEDNIMVNRILVWDLRNNEYWLHSITLKRVPKMVIMCAYSDINGLRSKRVLCVSIHTRVPRGITVHHKQFRFHIQINHNMFKASFHWLLRTVQIVSWAKCWKLYVSLIIPYLVQR